MKSSINNLEEVYEVLQKDEVNLDTKFSYNKHGKSHMLQLGRIWFNCLLPDDYPLINYAVNKKELYKIIDDLYDKYDIEKVAKLVSVLNKEAFKLTSILPASFSINDTILPDDIKEEKEKTLNKSTKMEEFNPKLTELSEKYINSMPDDSGIKDIISSGARGKPLDYGVLQIAKGPVLTIEGNITESITSSLGDGYNSQEYYDAAAGARRGYFIRSRGTAEPGTLARGTTYANSNTKITIDDCKTKKYFELEVTSKIADVIYGRYYLNPKTNKVELVKDPEKLIGKNIKMRSPLYCKAKDGICKICYGELSNQLQTKYIGLLAGEVINDAGQAFTMSQRHKSTNVSIKEVDFTKDIVNI